ESLFALGIARVPPDVRRVYDDVSMLSDSTHILEQRHACACSDSQFLEAQWKASDPTVATRINERRLTQWDRVLWSDLLFGDAQRHIAGWTTDPGIAWIRYGKPRKWDYFLFPARWEWTYLIDRDLRTISFLDRFLNDGFAIEWPPLGTPLG